MQTYLKNPMLINKKKFDFRMYVLMIGTGDNYLILYTNNIVRICY
jgi:hypothetical protein